MTAAVHRRWVLAAHPEGAPKESDFRLEEGPVPVPGPGEFLARRRRSARSSRRRSWAK
jgi:NADPH-dependent curcumin reductase CurA